MATLEVSLFIFLFFSADRPCLDDRGRVLRVQRSVDLGLRHILIRDNQEGLMPKVTPSVWGRYFPNNNNDKNKNYYIILCSACESLHERADV